MAGTLSLIVALFGVAGAQEAPQPTEPAEPPVPAQVVAVTGGRVLSMAGEPIQGGTVLIADGKVRAVGTEVEIPEGATRIDATGKTVMPGLIDCVSRLYIYPQELSEPSQIAAQLRMVDGLDIYARDTQQLLRHGVTAVHVLPGTRGLIGGRTAVLKVTAKPGDVEAVTDGAAVRGQIGVPSGSSTASLQRLGDYASIRETLLSTRDYVLKLEKYERDLATYERKKEEAKEKKDPKEEPPERPEKPSADPNSEVLAGVLRGEIPLQIEAHRVSDILNALRLKDEFEIRLVLLGCSEGHRIAGEIARRDVPVIVAPVSTTFGGPPYLRYGEHSRGNAAELAAAGVRAALGVGGSEGLQSKFVRECAAIAAANGLGRTTALEAVTVRAAELLGVGDRIGSLAEGRDGDLVIIDGDPLDPRSKVERVLINGETVYDRGAEG